MGEINLTDDEMSAIKAVDNGLLRKLIDQCLQEETIHPLRALRLERCGDFVAARQRDYAKALADLEKAKAAKKVAEMEGRARRAGDNLANAVHQMMHRAKAEEEERQLFFVDDHIIPPTQFDERMSVCVSYQWRKSVDDAWVHASITFNHEVIMRPDYSLPKPKRKPSAAKQAQDRQERLWREWDHLKGLSLHSVKQFLKDSGNGVDIPKTFKATVDAHSGALNNYSTKFWR